VKIKVWQVTLSMYRKYHKLRQQVGFIKGNLTRIIIYSRKCSFYILLIEVRNVGNNLISKSDRKPLPQAIAPHFPTFGRVEEGYYSLPLSVKSGRAAFTAPSFRCS